MSEQSKPQRTALTSLQGGICNPSMTLRGILWKFQPSTQRQQEVVKGLWVFVGIRFMFANWNFTVWQRLGLGIDLSKAKCRETY